MDAKALKFKIHEIIFEADTPAGKAFDVVLLILIVVSVLAVMLETVPSIFAGHDQLFWYIELGLTILFTLEYLLRIYATKDSLKYILSFYGIVDLLSILPTYLSFFISGTHYLLTIRALRLLRVFRILKLSNFMWEGKLLMDAMLASRRKIIVFMSLVLTIVIIVGSTMYMVEGEINDQFSSIPESMYWAIVTMTTVGYGDISPTTPLGKLLASVLMFMGYAILAVPTGIVSAELTAAETQRRRNLQTNTIACPNCSREGHDSDAEFCKFCGHTL